MQIEQRSNIDIQNILNHCIDCIKQIILLCEEIDFENNILTSLQLPTGIQPNIIKAINFNDKLCELMTTSNEETEIVISTHPLAKKKKAQSPILPDFAKLNIYNKHKDITPTTETTHRGRHGSDISGEKYMYIVKNNGRGACLYHSLTFGEHGETSIETAYNLRAEICIFMNDKKDDDITGNGLTLKQAVENSEAKPFDNYIQFMMKSSSYAGQLEIWAFVNMKPNITVKCHEITRKNEDTNTHITETIQYTGPGDITKKKVLHILYHPRHAHYEALTCTPGDRRTRVTLN
jgi:hypothetical protein